MMVIHPSNYMPLSPQDILSTLIIQKEEQLPPIKD
jgi:hypothetical protein